MKGSAFFCSSKQPAWKKEICNSPLFNGVQWHQVGLLQRKCATAEHVTRTSTLTHLRNVQTNKPLQHTNVLRPHAQCVSHNLVRRIHFFVFFLHVVFRWKLMQVWLFVQICSVHLCARVITHHFCRKQLRPSRRRRGPCRASRPRKRWAHRGRRFRISRRTWHRRQTFCGRNPCCACGWESLEKKDYCIIFDRKQCVDLCSIPELSRESAIMALSLETFSQIWKNPLYFDSTT